MNAIYMIAAVLVLGASIDFLVFRRLRRDFLKPFGSLLDERSGQLKHSWVGSSSIAGHFKGRPTKLTVREGSKGHASQFDIELRCSPPVTFEVTKQWLSSQPTRVDFAPWVRRPEARASLTNLFGAGVDRLRVKNKAIIGLYYRYKRRDIGWHTVGPVLEAMSSLAQSLDESFRSSP